MGASLPALPPSLLLSLSLLLLLLLLSSPSAAVDGIDSPAQGSFTLRHDSRTAVTISAFGLDPKGFFNISFTNYKIAEGGKETEPLGLFVQRTLTPAPAAVDEAELCLQLSNFNPNSFMDRLNASFYPLEQDFDRWELVHEIGEEEGGIWTFLFANCRKVPIDCQISHTQYNEGLVYLAVGEMPLPVVFGVMAIVYAFCFAFWLTELVCKKDRKVLWPHWLMQVLLLVKTTTLLLLCAKYAYLKRGYNADGWSISFYIFTFLRGSLTIIILVLIGTGWIFIKPFLSSRDKRIFGIVIPLQIFANISQVVVSEMERGANSMGFWSLIFPMVDIMCCVLIIAPILNTRKHLDQAHPDGKAEHLKQKYAMWGKFYFVTLLYLYSSRFVVQLLVATLHYKKVWFSDLFLELSTFLFYLLVGYIFRPVASNPYLQVETDDEETSDAVQMENLGTATGLHQRRTGSEP